MMRRLGVVFVSLVLLSGALQPVQAQATADALQVEKPDYTRPGPFGVGTQVFTIPDEIGQRDLYFTVFYPALATETAGDATGETTSDSSMPTLQAQRDAAAALTEAPYPLLIISHGLAGSNTPFFPLAMHLASYGFVVASTRHNDNAYDFSATLDIPKADQVATLRLYDRPHDIVREIAYADTLTAADGALAGLIDTEHIAVLGHSTGGTTAFQGGGARVDFRALETWCADTGVDDFTTETCQFVGHETGLAIRYGVDYPQEGMFPPLWDDRVDAIVAASPGGELHAFGDDGIAAVQVPTLILVGTADDVVSPEYNAFWAYDHISSPYKALAAFEGGTHSMFEDCCGYDPVQDGPHFGDRQAYLTTAFLLDVLKSDPIAHAALLPDAVVFPGVEYRTTLQ